MNKKDLFIDIVMQFWSKNTYANINWHFSQLKLKLNRKQIQVFLQMPFEYMNISANTACASFSISFNSINKCACCFDGKIFLCTILFCRNKFLRHQIRARHKLHTTEQRRHFVMRDRSICAIFFIVNIKHIFSRSVEITNNSIDKWSKFTEPIESIIGSFGSIKIA